MEGRNHSSIAKVMIFIIDCWLIHLAFSIVRARGMDFAIPEVQFTTLYLVFSLTWIAAGLLNKVYRLDSISIVQILSVNTFNAFLTHIAITVVVFFTLDIFSIHLKTVIWLYGLSIILLATARVAYKIIRKYLEFSGFERHNVVIVGITGSGRTLHEFFEKNPENGYRFKGFFSNELVPGYKNLTIGGLDDIKEYCTKERVDEIYFTLPLVHQHLLKELTPVCRRTFHSLQDRS